MDFTIPKGFAGQQAEMVPATFVSLTATGTIKSGQPVALDGEGKCKKATDGTGFQGIASGVSTKREWQAGEEVRIMTMGGIYLEAAAATTAGSPIGFSSTGTWADAATTTYPTQINGSQVDAGTAGAGICRARLFGVETTSL